MGFQSLVKCGH